MRDLTSGRVFGLPDGPRVFLLALRVRVRVALRVS